MNQITRNAIVNTLHTVHKRIFKDREYSLGEQLGQIREKHELMTATPNFFFRGQSFITDHDKPVVLLAKELHEEAKGYLQQVKNFNQDKRVVTSFFGRLYGLEEVGQIYYCLPKITHEYFEGPPNVPEPDNLDDILDGSHEDAFRIINAQALYKLIS